MKAYIFKLGQGFTLYLGACPRGHRVHSCRLHDGDPIGEKHRDLRPKFQHCFDPTCAPTEEGLYLGRRRHSNRVNDVYSMVYYREGRWWGQRADGVFWEMHDDNQHLFDYHWAGLTLADAEFFGLAGTTALEATT